MLWATGRWPDGKAWVQSGWSEFQSQCGGLLAVWTQVLSSPVSAGCSSGEYEWCFFILVCCWSERTRYVLSVVWKAFGYVFEERKDLHSDIVFLHDYLQLFLYTLHTQQYFFSGPHVQGPRPRTWFPSVTSSEGRDREYLIINVFPLVGDQIWWQKCPISSINKKNIQTPSI